jgi:hypothetical protein
MTKFCNKHSYANVLKPQWSPDKEEVWGDVLESVGQKRGFKDAGLKKQITVTVVMSSPVVGGKTEKKSNELLSS